jgi:hypothetical protein
MPGINPMESAPFLTEPRENGEILFLTGGGQKKKDFLHIRVPTG